MKQSAIAICFALAAAISMPASAHECRVRDGYIRGSFEGACDEKAGVANGYGEASSTDSYIGMFVDGHPDGKGVYTWQNGGRLEGTFKAGKANGPGTYVSAKGVRYEGPFENGKLTGAKREDCPVTRGPLEC